MLSSASSSAPIVLVYRQPSPARLRPGTRTQPLAAQPLYSLCSLAPPHDFLRSEQGHARKYSNLILCKWFLPWTFIQEKSSMLMCLLVLGISLPEINFHKIFFIRDDKWCGGVHCELSVYLKHGASADTGPGPEHRIVQWGWSSIHHTSHLSSWWLQLWAHTGAPCYNNPVIVTAVRWRWS